jgi:hypothetical protein
MEAKREKENRKNRKPQLKLIQIVKSKIQTHLFGIH